MDPEAYRDEYLQPFSGEYQATVAMKLEELIYLPQKSYYHEGEEYPYMYNFTIDNLTRQELLQLISETGFGDPAGKGAGSLVSWVTETERVSEARRVLLIDREERLAKMQQDLDGLMHSRSYRMYRLLMAPLRVARRAWRTVRPKH